MTERSRTPPQSLTISRLSPMTLSHTSVKSEVASINVDHETDVPIEQDMHVANDQAKDQAQAIQETVVRRSNVAIGKEQRPTTYIEGKFHKCITALEYY